MATMTQSLEDYLEAIYVRIAGGKPAQVRDVARMLAVKMPSVVKAVRELKKMGLVTQEPYSNIELTVKGERVARHVLGRHTLIREFLMKLGVTRGDQLQGGSAEHDVGIVRMSPENQKTL